MAFLSALAIHYPGISILAVAAKDSDLQEVLYKWRIIQGALIADPFAGHPGARHDSKDQYTYRNGSRVSWTAIGGAETVADAVGRAGTFGLVWMTELAFPDKPELVPIALEALRPAIRKARAGVIIDTTPNDPEGAGAAYHAVVQDTMEGRLPGDVHFWPWWMDPENTEPLGQDPVAFARSLTSEERSLVLREGLTLQQIAFRRRLMTKPGMSVAAARAKFLIQYPETMAQAFAVRRQSSLFNADVMSALEERFRYNDGPAPISVEDLQGLAHDNDRDLVLRRLWGHPGAAQGYTRTWAPPTGEPTFAGVDCSEGLPGGDWQTLTILDAEGATLVEARHRVHPLRFAALAQRLLEAYRARARFEAQDGHLVHAYITQPQAQALILKHETYPGELAILARSWADCQMVHINTATRPRLITCAFAILEQDEGAGCLTPECYREMLDLRRKPSGKIEARDGAKCHDDLIKSKGLAGWMREDAMTRTRSQEVRKALRGVRTRGRARGRYSYLN
jgi:hypothetical protein